MTIACSVVVTALLAALLRVPSRDARLRASPAQLSSIDAGPWLSPAPPSSRSATPVAIARGPPSDTPPPSRSATPVAGPHTATGPKKPVPDARYRKSRNLYETLEQGRETGVPTAPITKPVLLAPAGGWLQVEAAIKPVRDGTAALLRWYVQQRHGPRR